jgi:hypothetical protein
MIDNNNKQQQQQVAGFAKSLKGLDFVVVYNSGHLVPNNRPVAALDLITRFVRGESYLDLALPRFDRPEQDSFLSSKTNEATTRTAGRSGVNDVVVLVAVAISFFCLGLFVARGDRKRMGYTAILTNGDESSSQVEM